MNSLRVVRYIQIGNTWHLGAAKGDPGIPQLVGTVASASIWEEYCESRNVRAAASVNNWVWEGGSRRQLFEWRTMIVYAVEVHDTILGLEKLSNRGEAI